MGGIFISYRRDDTQGEARHLHADLQEHFGQEQVFIDVATLAFGRDFRVAIEEAIAQCNVFIVMIGDKWLTSVNQNGVRRLDDAKDYVHLEVAAALRRGQEIAVIPLLVQKAEMPSVEQLPAELEELAYRNGFEVRHNRWDVDVAVLVKGLEKNVPLRPHPLSQGDSSPLASILKSTSTGEGESSRQSDVAASGNLQQEVLRDQSIGGARKPFRLTREGVLLLTGALLVGVPVWFNGLWQKFGLTSPGVSRLTHPITPSEQRKLTAADVALYAAVQKGDIASIQLLLEAGANVNAKATRDETPIIPAIYYNHLDVVKLLVAAGADVNAKAQNGDPAVVLAIRKGKLEIVQTLLAAKVDLAATTKDGKSAVVVATESNSPEIVALVLQTKRR